MGATSYRTTAGSASRLERNGSGSAVLPTGLGTRTRRPAPAEDCNRSRACPTGTYPYRRPPKDHEYSFFVDELADEATFEFTDQHRSLLTTMSWELSDPYFDEDIPSADPKRPYGDFT